MQVAADCLLALAGHDPDDASAEARAGAILVADGLSYLAAIGKMMQAALAAPKGRRRRR